MPRRSNCQATAPDAPRLPSFFVKTCRTLDAVRLRVVRQRLDENGDAAGAVALVDDRL